MPDPIIRPTPREIFLTRDRQLQVFFYTSNIQKFLQARVVFETAGLLLQHFRSKTDPYNENYEEGKEQLLSKALKQILGSVGSGSLFFVEDTSLRIEALSSSKEDVPGLAVKEWFPSNTFAQLDSQLLSRGNDRRAVIKSDIALHVPGYSHPMFFHGSVAGTIADTPPNFVENSQYPWLTPTTFNGWFIPETADKRLGEMSLEESWRFDFRIRAFEALIQRLEEFTAILNLPPQAYVRRQSPDPLTQLPLFTGTVLIVVGHTCAGKTTFGDRARDVHGMLHIEASSVLRMVQHDDEETKKLNTFEYAKQLLFEKGPDVLARKILQIYASKFERGVVITGFRTIEELELIKSHFPQATVLLVEASERTRYQRLLLRGRSPECKSLEDFKMIDAQQWSFGLLRVAEDFADLRVINEGSIEQYKQQIDAVLSATYNLPGINITGSSDKSVEISQLLRCLSILDAAGRPMSTDEIEEASESQGGRIRHNNANKVLKRVPELARRLEMDGTRVRYELLNAGRAYLRFMQRQEELTR